MCFFIAVNQRANELTYSNMQIIAREVELQTMRRSAPKNANSNTPKQNQAPQKPKPQNHLQRLNTRGTGAARTKDLVCFDLSPIYSCFHLKCKQGKYNKSCYMIMTALNFEKKNNSRWE